MFGRTYLVGYEQDLEATLLTRPRRRVLDPEWPWAIWYPLRRVKTFETLPEQEQRIVLMEHAGIGMSFGKAGYAHDIRLACHGLDKNDNDFVIGVLGRELYPLSALIQAMRKTKQTSQYLESLGRFHREGDWQANSIRKPLWHEHTTFPSHCTLSPAIPTPKPGRMHKWGWVRLFAHMTVDMQNRSLTCSCRCSASFN